MQAARATSSADDCALTKAVLDLTESAGNSQLLPSPMVPQSSAAECPAPPDGQSAETAAHAYDSARLAAAQQWGTKLYAQIPTQLRRMVPYTQGESSKVKDGLCDCLTAACSSVPSGAASIQLGALLACLPKPSCCHRQSVEQCQS